MKNGFFSCFSDSEVCIVVFEDLKYFMMAIVSCLQKWLWRNVRVGSFPQQNLNMFMKTLVTGNIKDIIKSILVNETSDWSQVGFKIWKFDKIIFISQLCLFQKFEYFVLQIRNNLPSSFDLDVVGVNIRKVLEEILNLSWRYLEAILWLSWGYLEALLRPSWTHLEALLRLSWGDLEAI